MTLQQRYDTNDDAIEHVAKYRRIFPRLMQTMGVTVRLKPRRRKNSVNESRYLVHDHRRRHRGNKPGASQYVAVSDDRMGSVSSGSIVRVTRRFPRGTYVRAVATRVSRRASSSAEALREESDLIVD